MTAGMPPTFGSLSARWLSRDARRTWPSRGWIRCSRGQHVHQLGEDGDGGGGPVGDQPHHAGQVGVLQGQPGQVPVHGDELAQGGVLAVQVPRGGLGVIGVVAGQHR
jgi:hypothetical protein